MTRELRFFTWLTVVPIRGATAFEWVVLGVFLLGFLVFLASFFLPPPA